MPGKARGSLQNGRRKLAMLLVSGSDDRVAETVIRKVQYAASGVAGQTCLAELGDGLRQIVGDTTS